MKQRYKDVKIASIIGMLGNIFLLIIKGSISIITNSQAMLADTFNSASDILSSIMTYIGNKIASQPIDEDHNLGHGKAEYIYSLLISIVMFILAYKSLKSSIISVFKRNNYHYSNYLLIVCLTTIIVKLLLYLYTNTISKKYNNLLMKANSKDHLNDTFITSLNLSAAILSRYNIFLVDSVVGIIISTWIFITAYTIFKESYDILMDKSISIETKNKVMSIIEKHDEVKKVIHFNSTPIGYRYQVSFSIFVDGNLSTFDSHDIANNLEEEIIKEIDEIYLVVIHVNPCKTKK
ncbi:MAG: cation diffusion facilitator family transporter [Bacilli bacterium]|nr:cation diffusion facilitator family transporter [Bacilli bacterium]